MKKGLAEVVIGFGKKPSEDSGDDDAPESSEGDSAEYEPSEAAAASGRRFAKAVQSGDGAAIAKAFQELMLNCDED